MIGSIIVGQGSLEPECLRSVERTTDASLVDVLKSLNDELDAAVLQAFYEKISRSIDKILYINIIQ